MTTLKLGKLPARKNAITIKFGDYNTAVLKPPRATGHRDFITGDIGMLGNDQYGDCVWAGAAHETMFWNKEASIVCLSRRRRS